MRSGPEMPLKTQIALAVVCTSVFLWVLPAINTWIKTQFPLPSVHARAPESPEAEAARRYAKVIAACMNGETITDGKHFFECRKVVR